MVLARGELDDKLEGPKYTARRAELRREAGEAARARDRQAAAASQDEAQICRGERRDRQRMKRQTVASLERDRTTRGVGRPRGGMKVALATDCKERLWKRQTPTRRKVGDG